MSYLLVFSILCFVIDYIAFSFGKQLRCDVPVITRLLGNIYLAFIHSSWLTDSWTVGILWLIRDMAASVFTRLLFVLRPWEHFRATPGLGVTFCIWGPCLYCIQWHHCFAEGGIWTLESMSGSTEPRAGPAQGPGEQAGRAQPLAPRLLREHCWTSRRWSRPGSEGVHRTSQRPASSKGQAGTVKEQETSVLVRTWGKGTLGHCWWELNRCGYYGNALQVPQNWNRTSSTFTFGPLRKMKTIFCSWKRYVQ